MTRFFYTDPLAAQWMGAHFGMRFEGLPDPVYWHEDAIQAKIYVNPDSLALLQPQIGDLVTNTHDPENAKHRPYSGLVVGFINRRTSVFVHTSERHNGKNEFCEDVSALRIVQRNGIAFMWPESEESEAA